MTPCTTFEIDQEEIRKLQEAVLHHAKLVKNIKLRNEIAKREYRSDSHGLLCNKVQDHGKEFSALTVPKTNQKTYCIKGQKSRSQWNNS